MGMMQPPWVVGRLSCTVLQFIQPRSWYTNNSQYVFYFPWWVYVYLHHRFHSCCQADLFWGARHNFTSVFESAPEDYSNADACEAAAQACSFIVANSSTLVTNCCLKSVLKNIILHNCTVVTAENTRKTSRTVPSMISVTPCTIWVMVSLTQYTAI